MSKTSKVAISLPAGILDSVECERKESGESRSEFFRQAIEMLLHKRKEEEDIKQYIRGYKKLPETREEIAAADQAAVSLLAQEPW
jgi:metal-responsive CopG/Arc/MetJ family transcriptional regulator